MTTQNEKEFKRDHLQLLVKEEPNCQVTFKMQVSPAGVQSAYTQALRSINKGVSIPGFRKGKAPDQLVLKHYSTHVDREWRNVVIDTAFNEAIETSQIYPRSRNALGSPKVNKCSREEGAEIIISFERYPQIPALDLSKIQLTRVKPEPVTDAQAEDSLQEARRVYREWEELPTDRQVQEGDFVDLDITSLGEKPHDICTDMRFEAVKGQMHDWMRNLVIGKRKGDVLEGESAPDEGDHPKDFKSMPFRLTIKAIHKEILPVLDDEFAKKMRADDLADLRKKIRHSLELRMERIAYEQMRYQLEDRLLALCPVDVPSGLVEEEFRLRLKHAAAALQVEQLSSEQLEKAIKEIEGDCRLLAERFIKLYFITHQLAEKEKLPNINKEDLLGEYHRQTNLPMHERQIDNNMKPEEIRNRLVAIITIRKVKDHILSQLGLTGSR